MRQSHLKSSLKKTSRDPGYKKVTIADANKIQDGLHLGLFARKNIRKGETIFIARGNIISLNIRSSKDSFLYPNAIGISKGLWLDPHNNNPLRYLNHSCNPNAGIRGTVTFVAMKNIRAGEHITIDYSITECDTLWQLDNQCSCGAPNCRKVIRSIQYLPVTIYRKYLPYIPRTFQNEFSKFNKMSNAPA